ncbi:hypothetical protein K0U07_04155 [bacterium]|nr:hypothetical protein [bacterium]
MDDVIFGPNGCACPVVSDQFTQKWRVLQSCQARENRVLEREIKETTDRIKRLKADWDRHNEMNITGDCPGRDPLYAFQSCQVIKGDIEEQEGVLQELQKKVANLATKHADQLGRYKLLKAVLDAND